MVEGGFRMRLSYFNKSKNSFNYNSFIFFFLVNSLKKKIFFSKMDFFSKILGLYLKNSSDLYSVLSFLKNSSLLKIESLIDVIVVDNYKKKKRFKLTYNLLSVKFKFRLYVTIFLKENEPVCSVYKLFESSV